jgi:hypothetical protein
LFSINRVSHGWLTWIEYCIAVIKSGLIDVDDIKCVFCRHSHFSIIHNMCQAPLTHLSGFIPGIFGLMDGLSVHVMERLNIDNFLRICELNKVCLNDNSAYFWILSDCSFVYIECSVCKLLYIRFPYSAIGSFVNCLCETRYPSSGGLHITFAILK